jgi:hypothetical protein
VALVEILDTDTATLLSYDGEIPSPYEIVDKVAHLTLRDGHDAVRAVL